MKVLELFGGVIRRGGEEMFVYNVLSHYNDPDTVFDCLVVEGCENDGFKSWVEAQGGAMTAMGENLHATRFSNHIYKPALKYLKEHSYDVIHIHSSSIAALAVLASAARRSGSAKVIVHSHSVGSADSFEHRLFRTLAAVSMRRHVDMYCACSKAAAQWKFAPKYAEKAVIVKNGIDTERFRYCEGSRHSIRSELNIPDDAFVIGNVGRLCALKNQSFLLDVFSVIAKEQSNAYLLLIGEGEDAEKLRRRADELRISDRVIFKGIINNVNEYMSAMDVFAFPSEYEGLGIVAIEAQCAGLPVVASSGVPEEIRLTDNVTILNVSNTAESTSEWASELTKPRSVYRENGVTAVRDAGFDISSTVKQIKDIYRS